MLAGLGREVTIDSGTPAKVTTVHLARMPVAATACQMLFAEHVPPWGSWGPRPVCWGIRPRYGGVGEPGRQQDVGKV